jgi:DNA processing protein
MIVTEDAATCLTAAELRTGPDTRICREFRHLMEAGLSGPCLLAALGGRLGTPPAEFAGRLVAARLRAGRSSAQARARGIDLVTPADPTYPPLLAAIADPPLALWTSGPGAWGPRSVAIVGSRTATPGALAVATELSRGLAARGYVIVSGMAAGVDGAAHAAALDVEGATVAVLGCGLDRVYPGRHAGLQAAVKGRGRLVSEFPPATGPRAWHFPLRNRIIAGLSQAVVVIEASRKSGSLITARLALAYDREVMAVPGSVASGRSGGCHALIRDGARLVESVRDVVEPLEGVGAMGEPETPVAAKPLSISYLNAIMAPAETWHVDVLAARAARSASTILADLTQLELTGEVRRAPGGGFVRT